MAEGPNQAVPQHRTSPDSPKSLTVEKNVLGDLFFPKLGQLQTWLAMQQVLKLAEVLVLHPAPIVPTIRCPSTCSVLVQPRGWCRGLLPFCTGFNPLIVSRASFFLP